MQSENVSIMNEFDKSNLREIEMTPELITYSQDLKAAVENGWDALFSNSGPEHAAVLLSTIFDNTKKELYIYGSSLRDELTSFKIYYKALRNCIKRGVKVNVLLEKELDEEKKSPVRKWLEVCSGNNKNVEVRSVENVEKVMQRQLPNATHFTVADGKMFRLEYDRDKFRAYGSMNSSLMSVTLKKAFEGAFASVR